MLFKSQGISKHVNNFRSNKGSEEEQSDKVESAEVRTHPFAKNMEGRPFWDRDVWAEWSEKGRSSKFLTILERGTRQCKGPSLGMCFQSLERRTSRHCSSGTMNGATSEGRWRADQPLVVLDWPKGLGFYLPILWENPGKLIGQPHSWYSFLVRKEAIGSGEQWNSI